MSLWPTSNHLHSSTLVENHLHPTLLDTGQTGHCCHYCFCQQEHPLCLTCSGAHWIMIGTSMFKFSIDSRERKRERESEFSVRYTLCRLLKLLTHSGLVHTSQVGRENLLWHYAITWTDSFSPWAMSLKPPEVTGDAKAVGNVWLGNTKLSWASVFDPCRSQSSVLCRGKWFPVHLGLLLRIYSDPAWQSPPRASLTAGASLSDFSVRHCSAMKCWVEVQCYPAMPKIRGLVFEKTINRAVWKFCKTVFKCSIKRLMLSNQNEGILFMCAGEVVNLEIFCFIIFALITTFQNCDTFLLPNSVARWEQSPFWKADVQLPPTWGQCSQPFSMKLKEIQSRLTSSADWPRWRTCSHLCFALFYNQDWNT